MSRVTLIGQDIDAGRTLLDDTFVGESLLIDISARRPENSLLGVLPYVVLQGGAISTQIDGAASETWASYISATKRNQVVVYCGSHPSKITAQLKLGTDGDGGIIYMRSNGIADDLSTGNSLECKVIKNSATAVELKIIDRANNSGTNVSTSGVLTVADATITAPLVVTDVDGVITIDWNNGEAVFSEARSNIPGSRYVGFGRSGSGLSTEWHAFKVQF